MKGEKVCLQQTHGPTPCFRNDAKSAVCSLDFCPAADYLAKHPEKTAWKVLHSHCVMSDAYGDQKDYQEGQGEYIATIAMSANGR